MVSVYSTTGHRWDFNASFSALGRSVCTYTALYCGLHVYDTRRNVCRHFQLTKLTKYSVRDKRHPVIYPVFVCTRWFAHTIISRDKRFHLPFVCVHIVRRRWKHNEITSAWNVLNAEKLTPNILDVARHLCCAAVFSARHYCHWALNFQPNSSVFPIVMHQSRTMYCSRTLENIQPKLDCCNGNALEPTIEKIGNPVALVIDILLRWMSNIRLTKIAISVFELYNKKPAEKKSSETNWVETTYRYRPNKAARLLFFLWVLLYLFLIDVATI